MGILLAAHEWGIPPWDIMADSKIIWYLRWVEYHNLVNRPKNG